MKIISTVKIVPGMRVIDLQERPGGNLGTGIVIAIDKQNVCYREADGSIGMGSWEDILALHPDERAEAREAPETFEPPSEERRITDEDRWDDKFVTEWDDVLLDMEADRALRRLRRALPEFSLRVIVLAMLKSWDCCDKAQKIEELCEISIPDENALKEHTLFADAPEASAA